MEPLDPDAVGPNAGDSGPVGPEGEPSADPHQPYRLLANSPHTQTQDNGGGVGDALAGAADLASPVVSGLDLASGAVGAAGDVVAGGAEVVGEVASGALEGIGAVAEGCGSCSLAVLVMLFAAVGTAFALVR